MLAWNSSKDNAVQAEYIIMEKAKGVQLSAVKPSMHFKQRTGVVKSIARYQKAWGKLSFNRIGSLYYAEDLKPDERSPVQVENAQKLVPGTRFAIGPIVGREWSDAGRAGLGCDRGPCKSP